MESKSTKELFIIESDLIKFANEFSSKYKLLSKGIYRSDNLKYIIEYVIGSEEKRPLKDVVGVNIKTGDIYLNREILLANDKYTENFVFYLILWASIHKDIRNRIEVDMVSIPFYLKQGRPLKDLVLGFSSFFKIEKNRMDLLENFINDFNKKNNDEKN